MEEEGSKARVGVDHVRPGVRDGSHAGHLRARVYPLPAQNRVRWSRHHVPATSSCTPLRGPFPRGVSATFQIIADCRWRRRDGSHPCALRANNPGSTSNAERRSPQDAAQSKYTSMHSHSPAPQPGVPA